MSREEYRKEYYQKHKEEICARLKERYHNEKDFRERQKNNAMIYNETHKEEIKERRKEYVEKNKDRIMEYNKSYAEGYNKRRKEKRSERKIICASECE